jgi:CBS domain containing-hemolysin-like protein
MGFSVEVACSTPVHDLRDMGVDLPGGGLLTVGGLIDDWLGRQAVMGDTAWVNRWRITVVEGVDPGALRFRIERATLAFA